ncbi:MAG: hypothetical protein ABH857_02965 [Elusimicrobiota bacterium]
MQCQNCGQQNKDDAVNCKKCGLNLLVSPEWKPAWKWHIKALAGIYLCLIVLYVLLRLFLG